MRFSYSVIGLVLWIVITGFGHLYGQTPTRHTISGFVYEKGSRETLIGVNVFVPELNVGTVTNNYGFYSITLPADSVTIVYSYVGYARQVRNMNLTESVRLDIELDSAIDLEEVVVTDERMRRISQTTQMSRLEIPMQQARNIPSFLGEKDMFKVLQLMPGVQSGTEGTSGFYVRGGGPDQNLIILDDAIVYNANHLFGFFSVFNGDAIKNMQLYKGGFPSRFGGRLSSVLDIQMKDGSKEKFQGEAGIGIISSRLTLEGPVIKDKASFLISGRRTYLDLLIRPFLPEETQAGYFFYDLNSKLNYDINPNNRIFVSGYFGRDKFFFRDSYDDQLSVDRMENGLFWQNATGTVRWNHIFNDRLFANLSLVFSEYELTIFSEESFRDLQNNNTSIWELRYNSGIRDIGAKYDLTWNPLPQHYIRAGLQMIQHRFTPSAIVLRDDDIDQLEQNAEILNSVESGIYVEDEITLGDGIKINPGVRFSHFYADGKSYPNLEPRFASNVRILSDFSWKTSFAAMNQYVHLLSSTGIGLPTDLWVPSTKRIRPQKTWQIASGFAYDWTARNLEISLEGYYKKANDIIGYKEGASFLLIDDPSDAETFTWQDNITHGQGWSYGAEFLVQRKSGKLSGWVGYTLSWTQKQFDDINFGEKYFAKYDRRHDVSVVAVYEISKNTTLSGTWVFASGNVYDIGTGRFPVVTHTPNQDQYASYFQNAWWNTANVYDKKHSFRAASYQRFDVAIQFHKDLTRFNNPVRRTFELGVYNAYNRKNPFFYYWEDIYQPYIYNEDQQQNYTQRKLMQVSLFPLIPSVSVHYKF